jgi:hypothetical protein
VHVLLRAIAAATDRSFVRRLPLASAYLCALIGGGLLDTTEPKTVMAILSPTQTPPR